MNQSQSAARIWWNARLDAKHHVPSPDSTVLGDTERQILSATNREIQHASRAYAGEAKPLVSRLASHRKALNEIYQPEYERLMERAGRADIQVYLSRPIHLVLLIILTAGETAFNAVVFNLYREPALYTLLMAAAVSLAIPLCASVVGIWLRQWPEPKARTAVKIAAVLSVLVSAVFGINALRVSYLAELAPEFAKAHSGFGCVFIVLNLCVIAAAVLLGYLAHDPEPGFAEAKRKMDASNVAIHAIEGELARLRGHFEATVELAKEKGWELIGYYRMVLRRYHPAPPRYFDDESDKNHHPQFAELPALTDGSMPQEEAA
jgi:hypothetical protein